MRSLTTLTFAVSTLFSLAKAESLIEKHLPQLSSAQKLELVAALEQIVSTHQANLIHEQQKSKLQAEQGEKKTETEADSTEEALRNTQIDLKKEFGAFPDQYNKYYAALSGVAGTSALGFLIKSIVDKRKPVKHLGRFAALSFTGSTLYLGFESKKIGREDAIKRMETLIGEIKGLKALLIHEENIRKELRDGIIPTVEDKETTEHLPQSQE